MKKLILFGCCLFMLTNLVTAQKMSREVAKDSEYAPSGMIFKSVNIPIGHFPSEDELIQVLEPKLDILSKTKSGLQLSSQKKSMTAWHFRFNQTFNGVAVMDANLTVNMSLDYNIISILNGLYELPALEKGNFIISPEAIKARIQRDIPVGLWEVNAEPMYLAHNGATQAVIVAQTFGNDDAGGAWQIVFDAENGNEIFRRDIASYHTHTPPPTDTTCKAKVFMPDPITQAQTSYGGNYVDNNDMDSPWLNAWRVEVDLKDIQWDGSNFILEGPYVTIEDFDSPIIAPLAPSTCAGFDVLRSASGFEDVNTYYHIDTYKRYLIDLGFPNYLNQPIRVDPHGLNGGDNSKFVPGSNPYLSFGEGGVDDAEDADVILHEYGHAVSFGAAPGTNIGTERQGLDEGIGDYIASSYSLKLSPYRWHNVFSWDGHNEFWSGRISNDPMPYSLVDKGDIYEVGEVWASCLMSVQPKIGPTIMDSLFFEELDWNQANLKLPGAASIMLQIDSLMFNEANKADLLGAFCQWELITGVQCMVGINPEIPEYAWEVFPNPAQDRVTINLSPLALKQVSRIDLVNLMGQTLKSFQVSDTDVILDLADLKNGLYLVNLTGPNGAVGSKKIVIEH